MSMKEYPLSRPDIGGVEAARIAESLASGSLSGDGPFTSICTERLQSIYRRKVLLVHSCTAALEMAMILADLAPGDEVIMPSFTFVSTANAVVLRGAIPVFVDIRRDTLNIDESRIKDAITSRTRAIVPVHYAGVAAEMDAINAVAADNGLLVVEDAAQGIGATYKGRPLGGIGDLGCISFHVTKNIVSGEGGALVLGNDRFSQRAEIIREKGTNRSSFLRREVAKYEWLDVGSSYLPSDLLAALLSAQLEREQDITRKRQEIWQGYFDALADLERRGVQLPCVPEGLQANGHIFYLLVPGFRDELLRRLRGDGIGASSHYVPLHSAPAGRRYGKVCGDLSATDWAAAHIVRLPLSTDLDEHDVSWIIDRTKHHIDDLSR